jgi:hypothetical protein
MADDDGTPSGKDLTLEPPATVTKARPRALWGVLAVVALAAGALAVTSGGDGGERPLLPVALGATGSREAGTMAADSSLAWVTYVAGEGLPALGGEAAAYRLSGTVDRARVLALAAALGFEAPAEHLAQGGPVDGTWRVESDHGTLEVFEAGGGGWWFSAQQQLGDGSSGSGNSSSESAGCEPGPAVDCGFAEGDASITTVPGTRCAYDGESGCATTQTAIAECPPDASCAVEPAPPVDLPSKDEARLIALDLLAASGMDVRDANVTVDGPYDAWYVTVEPRLDGLLVVGWQANVGIGSNGAVTSASGMLGTPERLGRYPLIDTRAAIDRLNTLQGGGVMPMIGRGDIAVDSGPASAPNGGSAQAPDTTALCATAPDSPVGATSECQVPTTSTVVMPCKVQPDGAEICETQSSPPSVSCVAPPTQPGTDPAAQDAVGCGFPDACYDTAKPLEDRARETTFVDPACVDPVPMPLPEPMPDPEPLEVTLTQAEQVLMLMPSVDGAGEIYVVPGYRLSNADSAVVEVPAVADDSLAPTTTIPSQVNPPTEPPGPAPTTCEPLVEGDSSGSTHTLLPCEPEPEPELGPPDSTDTGGGAAEG